MALAILDSKDIPHPPIEAVFTVDEEIGMGGAENIDLSVLKGKKLINIDSEEEGILTVGCAGGFGYNTEIPVTRENEEGENQYPYPRTSWRTFRSRDSQTAWKWT